PSGRHLSDEIREKDMSLINFDVQKIERVCLRTLKMADKSLMKLVMIKTSEVKKLKRKGPSDEGVWCGRTKCRCSHGGAARGNGVIRVASGDSSRPVRCDVGCGASKSG